MKKPRILRTLPFDFHGSRLAWRALRDLAHNGCMFPRYSVGASQAKHRRRAVEWLISEGLVERNGKAGPRLTALGLSAVQGRSRENFYTEREVKLIREFRRYKYERGWVAALAERLDRTPAAIQQKFKELRRAQRHD